MFLLSDERIRELSHGEVLNMGKYNFNYKHPKPIPDGLYAENIFGPERDYTCSCGHHNPRARKSSEVITCEVCGVDYVKAEERSKRYGHIELNCHYINPFFLKAFAELIDVTPETLHAVSLGEVNLELEVNTAGALYGLDGKRYCLVINDSAELKGGISGLYDLLEKNIDCVETLRFSYAGVSEKYQKAGYNLLSFLNSTVVVSPPDARPLRRDGEKIFYDETNLIYSRLIRESSKLAALMSSDSLTPEQIQVVKSMTSCVVQKMINIQFIEGGEFGNAKLIPRIEKLKGKEGSLPRGALLGKTVDFSGRSVILSAPDMPVNSVGIPYAMLLELFKPDVVHWLTQKHKRDGVPSIKAFRKAQAQVKRLAPDTMEAIEGVVKDEYIILNRAPSLHMYSVMAFQVIPVSGKAIHMPPAAMAPFNADCLTGDMRIKTLDYGFKTVPELIELSGGNPDFQFFVWARNADGVQVPAVAHSPRLIRHVNEIVKVTLDNGQVITCTPNHEFMLKDGSYQEAEKLTVGQSLSPFYYDEQFTTGGFVEPRFGVYDSEKGWQMEHWLVYERYTQKSRKGMHVHHMDHNKLNNSPLNLELLSEAEHARHHMINYNRSEKRVDDLKKSQKFIQTARKNAIARNATQSALVSKLNSDVKFRKQISLGWQARSYAEIFAQGYRHEDITEAVLNKHRPGMVEKLEEIGCSIEECRDMAIASGFIEQAQTYYAWYPIADLNRFKVKRRGGIQFVNPQNLFTTFDKVLSNFASLDEIDSKSWEQHARVCGVYMTLDQFLAKIDRPLSVYFATRNHKVVSVETVSVEGEPVYDITVEEHHNYALEAGVYVHNCDGDTMSAHRHISDEACRELKEVVSFERNLLSAAAWDKVSTSPGHEQIVGSWLLTRALAEEPEDVKFIGLAKEALTRYDEGLLAFDDWIIVKTDDGQRLKTNMGALVHWELTGILPTRVLDKKGVKKYLLELCRTYGNDAYKYLTKLQRLWFRTSTKFGLSLAYDDVKKSVKQQALIDEVKAMPKDMDFDERIKAWDTNINKAVKNWFEKTDRNSSMIAMANSGARVTPVQVRQMIVSKGLLTSMQGGLEEPIPEALSEGLPVLSYIRTCGPARRGLAMNSFMVPASGYLERQLVNLCRDLNITAHDCKAEKGIELESSKAEGKILAEPVGDLKRGTILYKHMLKDLPKTVVVRSPIMCEHDNGLCAVCCGLNPATQDFYRLGTGIGVMAGTSTGEPLSQAGLRGKHSSGSVTLADLEYTVGNAVADFIKATGAQATSFLDIASSEAKPATSFNDLPYDQAAKAVLMELHRIFDESGIDIYTTLLETIVRGLSDVAVLSNGQSFLRSKGYNDPNPKFRTVVDSVSQNPSILKRLGFGWARQALENSVKNADGYQHLPVEKLMMGKLIHDCDRKEV